MSHLIPPMPSSTPPPLDDNLEDDEDEEFGDFAGVTSYCLEDVTSAPVVNTWEVRDVKLCNGDDTSQDSVVSGATDSGLCSAGEERAESGDDKNGKECRESSPCPQDVRSESPYGAVSGQCFESSNCRVTNDCEPDTSNVCSMESNINDVIISSSGVPDETPVFVINNHHNGEHSKHCSDSVEESHLDLEGSSSVFVNSSSSIVDPISDSMEDDFAEFSDAKNALNVRWDDKRVLNDQNSQEEDCFADFSSYSKPGEESCSFVVNTGCDWANDVSTEIESHKILDDDDFEDFETADASSTRHKETVLQVLPCESVTDVITLLFPVVTGDVPAGETKRDVISDSVVWCHLRDLETSNALSYQWAGSAANRLLLTSLAIDARNILFGPRWNTSVPRFAANLGLSPLEPVRSVRTVDHTPPSTSHTPPSLPVSETKPEDVVPAAQFDWSGSGLVNPLDSVHTSLLDLDILNTFDNLTSSSSTPDAAWTRKRFIPSPPMPSSVNQAVKVHHPPVETTQVRSELSLEARSLLESLPDLSFLRSRMLMFPVRGSGIDSPTTPAH